MKGGREKPAERKPDERMDKDGIHRRKFIIC
jgi:hypothetical protein